MAWKCTGASLDPGLRWGKNKHFQKYLEAIRLETFQKFEKTDILPTN